jgi:predicted DNA-binding transcriptional regulator AlpA
METQNEPVRRIIDPEQLLRTRAALSPKEFQAITGLSRRTIVRRMNTGEIPSFKLRRLRRIPVAFARKVCGL